MSDDLERLPRAAAATAAAATARTTAAATRGARVAARRTRPWIERLARVGFLAQAVVYIVVGGLALRAARTGGGETDFPAALRAILHQPLGMVPLAVVILGCFGWAAWQLIAAAADAGHDGGDASGIAFRVARAVDGLLYALLGVAAVRILVHAARGASGDDAARRWAAAVLRLPLGRWLVALAGAAVIAYGAWELWRAWRARVHEHLDLSALPARARQAALHLGRIGIAAHGAVLTVIGGFLLRAALHAAPHAATGFGGALHAIARGTHGTLLLAAVGVGLVAYGIFQVANAMYRVIEVP